MENPKSPQRPYYLRNVIAYWILGLTNNCGYVIMLTAAHDILANLSDTKIADLAKPGHRACHEISTGAILLADILPACIIKFLLPFLGFHVHLRISAAILLTIASFFMVAFAKTIWIALLGVVLTSLSIGIGETTFLAYSSKFHIHVITSWSSGTGAAGIFGSLSYAGLRDMKVSVRNTMLIMLFVPILEAIAFGFILKHPKLTKQEREEMIASQKLLNKDNVNEKDEDKNQLRTLKAKILYIPKLMKYIIPYFLVYFFEYFINMGLYQLIYFRDIFMDIGSQYRWLSFDYQVGVFISRSSVIIVRFEKIYSFAILQGINLLLFLMEALYFYVPYLWITFVAVLWEGLLGGAAYVNTYYNMLEDLPKNEQMFAMSCVSFSDALAIVAAGLMAIQAFNAICKLPEPKRR